MDRILDLDRAPPYVEVYEHAPLMYMSVCDFEKMSCDQKADDWVRWVHDVHVQIDNISAQCGIYKVKTGAQGASCAFTISPDMPPKEQAAIMLNSAKLLLKAINEMCSPAGDPLAAKLTIHAGQYAGGVVGTGSWTYDLYGEQVTALLAMDTLLDRANTIQVSEGALALLSNPHQFQYAYLMCLDVNEGPEAVPAKSISMYTLVQQEGNAQQAQLQLQLQQQQLAQASSDTPAGLSSTLGPYLDPVASMPPHVKPAAAAGMFNLSSCSYRVGEEMPVAEAAAAAGPGPSALRQLARPSFRSPETASASSAVAASDTVATAGATAGEHSSEAGSSAAAPAAGIAPAVPVQKSTDTRGTSSLQASVSCREPPGNAHGGGGVSDKLQMHDAASPGQAAGAQCLAATNMSLAYLDQVFILLSLLVSLSCFWGAPDGLSWDLTTWLCSGTFWFTPLLAFALFQFSPALYGSWREMLWSAHRMSRVAILCFTEAAVSTASAATLPWLRFGAVAMMIDALGFKVRFRLHFIVTSINLLLVVVATWFKATQQQAGGVFDSAARSVLYIIGPLLLVYYWEADQREQLLTGKRLRRKALNRLKAKLKEV